jgi:UDP-glucose 4-epimerase
MAILVTGGAGYIGSVIVTDLVSEGHEIIVLDNLCEGHRKAVDPGAAFYEGDIGDAGLLDRIFTSHSIECVIHMAAETVVEFSMREPYRFFNTNVVKGLTLLEAMRRHECDRMIFSSTAAVFGEPVTVPITEEHPKDPINSYGESKRHFERILEWYHRSYEFKYNAFRYFNAAGAHPKYGEDHNNETHIIPLVLFAAMGKLDAIRVFGSDYPTRDGSCVRDYVHVMDLSLAHRLALKNLDRRPMRYYNLGNSEGDTVLEVIETAKRVTGRDVPAIMEGRRSGDPAVLVASSDLARQELGWEPQYPNLEDIIRTAWEWHQAHPNGYKKG